jgi:hypothetical protein
MAFDVQADSIRKQEKSGLMSLIEMDQNKSQYRSEMTREKPEFLRESSGHRGFWQLCYMSKLPN